MGIETFYNDFYSRAEQSKTHAEMCRRVYGKNLCQHGMADMEQIDQLISELGIESGDRVVDLGCGTGRITEYIQTKTGAELTGLDLSDQAVQLARSRTDGASERLRFVTGDMLRPPFPPGYFTRVISVDAHYFIEDFESLLNSMLNLLAPGGQIGLFSDEGTGKEGVDESRLIPEETLIGLLLKERGIPYRAVNYFTANRKHWKLKAKVLEELKDEFIREGNPWIYESRMEECTCTDRETNCRFLFIIDRI